MKDKRKVFNDAIDFLTADAPENGVSMVSVDAITPFHDHPFKLYKGDRLNDMVESIKEHGILTPVIVRKLGSGYEMLAGHNRHNVAKLAGLTEIPAIVKEDLTDDEAWIYVVETNVIQRSFGDLTISERIAVLSTRYNEMDDLCLALVVGVELSYLSAKEQELVKSVLDKNCLSIKMDMAKKLRAAAGTITEESVQTLMGVDKPMESAEIIKPISVKLPATVYSKYFSDVAKKDVQGVLEAALEMYFDRKGA